ncbi:hypothetical protein [Fervidobacterium nodosum]|uniref:Lipoprotein n=1 Tax=Fervidobacterium nodosum (strain ATCC 35602 / DSM 5306 / Rt17-B1) TaxID=381764 RepID=A7HMW4_FERNB|nr:hypothetical protein [Fervidobacterium nodosum]ABS61247.1 hypothetical protein Fnod_1401 [Fervidobacterium nodosum Rt17-B1]
MVRKGIVITCFLFTISIFFSLQACVGTFDDPLHGWTISSKKDPMTGKESWYAISPEVKSLEIMTFPYSGTKARLVVATDGQTEWTYIWFNNAPNIVDFDFGSGGYLIINTRIKWDNQEPEYATFYKEPLSNFLNFGNDVYIIDKILNHEKLTVELNWYSQGYVHFEFPLAGGKEAVKQIRSKFNK